MKKWIIVFAGVVFASCCCFGNGREIGVGVEHVYKDDEGIHFIFAQTSKLRVAIFGEKRVAESQTKIVDLLISPVTGKIITQKEIPLPKEIESPSWVDQFCLYDRQYESRELDGFVRYNYGIQNRVKIKGAFEEMPCSYRYHIESRDDSGLSVNAVFEGDRHVADIAQKPHLKNMKSVVRYSSDKNRVYYIEKKRTGAKERLNFRARCKQASTYDCYASAPESGEEELLFSLRLMNNPSIDFVSDADSLIFSFRDDDTSHLFIDGKEVGAFKNKYEGCELWQFNALHHDGFIYFMKKNYLAKWDIANYELTLLYAWATEGARSFQPKWLGEKLKFEKLPPLTQMTEAVFQENLEKFDSVDLRGE